MSRPLLVGALLLPALVRAEIVNGAQIPDGAQKVAENRYRTTQNFEETLKYYKSAYPVAQYPRKSIINQPGVKAIHIAAPPGKTFEGLNIYEANEEVRIFIVTAEVPVKKKPVKKKK
jgi:hypothetical protein